MIKRYRNIAVVATVVLIILGLVSVFSGGNALFDDPDFINSWRPIAFRWFIQGALLTSSISIVLFLYPFLLQATKQESEKGNGI